MVRGRPRTALLLLGATALVLLIPIVKPALSASSVAVGSGTTDLRFTDATLEPKRIDATDGELLQLQVTNGGTATRDFRIGPPYDVTLAAIAPGETRSFQVRTGGDGVSRYWVEGHPATEAGVLVVKHASNVALELSILLSVAFVGYLVAMATRQSIVIGEILVGLVVGPSLLGWITVTDFVEGLALLGAIVLLFVAGLEHRFEDIFRGKYALIALGGVAVPWLGGYGFAIFSGLDFVSALFIGTALTATSIALTVEVLRELGRLDTEAGRAILGAAVIDDILGLMALAVTIQVAGGAVQTVELGLLGVKAVLFIGIGALVGKRVVQPALVRLDESRIVGKHPEVLFLVAINVAFLYSAVAELIGLSAIVGAFLAGVSLDATRRMRGRSFKEGAEYMTTVFASVFFVSLGVLVDLRQVGIDALPFMLILTLIAMATKLVGCTLPARLIHMSWRESLIVGTGMSPRGEVALIVALLALSAGAVGQEVYIAVVVMSLLTTLITPPILKVLAKPPRAPESGGGAPT